MAPEMIQGVYDEKCDIWSCGVILYMMLCGYSPFNTKNPTELKEMIMNSPITFPEEEWSQISKDAKDFLLLLLEKDPKKRISANEAVKHTWITSNKVEQAEPVRRGTIKALKNLSLFTVSNEGIIFFFISCSR